MGVRRPLWRRRRTGSRRCVDRRGGPYLCAAAAGKRLDDRQPAAVCGATVAGGTEGRFAPGAPPALARARGWSRLVLACRRRSRCRRIRGCGEDARRSIRSSGIVADSSCCGDGPTDSKPTRGPKAEARHAPPRCCGAIVWSDGPTSRCREARCAPSWDSSNRGVHPIAASSASSSARWI